MSLPGSVSPQFVELVAAGLIRRHEYDIAPVNVFGGAPPPAPVMNQAGVSGQQGFGQLTVKVKS